MFPQKEVIIRYNECLENSTFIFRDLKRPYFVTET
jgi:hypothetical protein